MHRPWSGGFVDTDCCKDIAVMRRQTAMRSNKCCFDSHDWLKKSLKLRNSISIRLLHCRPERVATPSMRGCGSRISILRYQRVKIDRGAGKHQRAANHQERHEGKRMRPTCCGDLDEQSRTDQYARPADAFFNLRSTHLIFRLPHFRIRDGFDIVNGVVTPARGTRQLVLGCELQHVGVLVM